MSESGWMLEDFLRRTGGVSHHDATNAYQVSLLRELLAILEAVLHDEGIAPATAHRIIRGVIYGGRPSLADAELRVQMNAEMVKLLERSPSQRPWSGLDLSQLT